MENVVLLILITKKVIKNKNIYMRSIYFEFEWCYNFYYQNSNKNKRRLIIKLEHENTV